MHTLPPALLGLARFTQFILYTLVPSQRRPGKMDKLPIDWRTGRPVDVTNAEAWTTFDNAVQQVAAGRGHGVGFAFSGADPFFFLDIDNCLQEDGQWSPLALELCAAFPGAAVEVSASGKGLHIIGTGAAAAPLGHRCKNIATGIEFYTRDRFCALTGTGAQGDVDVDCAHVVPWLLQYFLPAGNDAADADGWSEEPRPEWIGPTDDDELLRRALNSRSIASAFGGKATFADLWERNVDVLAVAYPDGEREFAESEADAALASHLAFWTGCNMERMRALMCRSSLARDKWGDRRPGGTWLDLTIRRSVAAQRDVCKDKLADVTPPGVPVAATESPQTPTAVDAPAVAGERRGGTFLRPADQRQLFAGCVYVLEAHRILIPGGMTIKPDQFRTRYGGRVFVMDEANEKTTRNAWEAFTESNVNVCPQADSAWFRPSHSPGQVTEYEGRLYVNTYYPAQTKRIPGDVSRFLEHLGKILPIERDRQILLSYMAAVVQYPGVKFQWAPLLQGAEGNGKSLFSRCVAYAVGERYTHWPRADQIAKNFNAWLLGKLFIGVEDMYLPEDRGEVWEILKPMITSDRQPVEPKGVDQQSLWVCCNFLLNSNHKDAIKKTRGDRRIAPLYCAQQSDNPDDVAWIQACGMGGDYFPKLYDWLKKEDGYAIVANYLATYQIPDEFNPATHCSRAPQTSSTEEAIRASLGTIEQEILEAIGGEAPGFRGGWISSTMLTGLLERIGRARGMAPRKREQLLLTLGYVRHPNLTGGRVDNIVLPDSGKPILFVRKDSPDLQITKPADIARAYSVAQGCVPS